MKRRVLLGIGVVVTLVAFMFLTLLVVRFVDIPGTEWDNHLDLQPLIMWELQVRARL